MVNRYSLVSMLFLGLSGASLYGAPLGPDVTEKFSVDTPSRVPGAVLDKGSYSIRVLDYLADRAILQVSDSKGAVRASFIGIRHSQPSTKSLGLTTWASSTAEPSYRSWALPNNQGVLEFAYPKADAVAIAKVNRAQVPAIDPESEGKSTVMPLPKDDMQVVTLWLLSSTMVGSENGEPAIQAAKFQSGAPMMAKARPVASRLPSSASNLTLIGLSGLLAFAAAGLIATRRTSRTSN